MRPAPQPPSYSGGCRAPAWPSFRHVRPRLMGVEKTALVLTNGDAGESLTRRVWGVVICVEASASGRWQNRGVLITRSGVWPSLGIHPSVGTTAALRLKTLRANSPQRLSLRIMLFHAPLALGCRRLLVCT